MKEEHKEISNSEGNIDKIKHVRNNTNNKLYNKRNNIKFNYIYSIFFLARIPILVILLFLYFPKAFVNKNNNKNEIICENGFFLPEDDQSKCIKCSIEQCMECTGNKLNNTCNKCNPGLNPIYEENKIISCSCNKGYYLINGHCRPNYTFKAIYKPMAKKYNYLIIFTIIK